MNFGDVRFALTAAALLAGSMATTPAAAATPGHSRWCAVNIRTAAINCRYGTLQRCKASTRRGQGWCTLNGSPKRASATEEHHVVKTLPAFDRRNNRG